MHFNISHDRVLSYLPSWGTNPSDDAGAHRSHTTYYQFTSGIRHRSLFNIKI